MPAGGEALPFRPSGRSERTVRLTSTETNVYGWGVPSGPIGKGALTSWHFLQRIDAVEGKGFTPHT